MTDGYRHPAFIRAEALSEPLRSHFPKSSEEAQNWKSIYRYRALASCVLAAAQTRVICQWAAYIDAVPGLNHEQEFPAVLSNGTKLREEIARAIFPEFDEIPYAD